MSELGTFLKTYEQAANSCDFANVAPLISNNAIFWFTNGTFAGKEAIRRAFEDTWAKIKDEVYTISNIQWIAHSDTVAVCVYDFTFDGIAENKRQIYKGRGTNVLQKSDGKWQIVHEHLSKAH
jgi:ketosteroid isomerase-like protein